MSNELLIDFKNFYETCIIPLIICGAQISMKNIKHKKLFMLYSLLLYLLLLCFNSGVYIYWFVDFKGMRRFCEIGHLANVCIMPPITIYFLFKKRKDLEYIIKNLNKEIFQPKNEEAKKIAEMGLNFYWKIKTTLIILSAIAVVSFLIIPIVTLKTKTLPLDIWLPFDASTYPNYELAYLYEIIGFSCDATINVFTDLLAAGFMTFIGVQCDLLCYELIQDKRSSFKEYIQYYQEIIEFSKITEGIFSGIYFFHFASTCSCLCMTLYLISLVEADSAEFIPLMTFLLSVMNLLLIPAWFSSELTRKSQNIPIAAYFHPWQNKTNNAKKDLIFFMQRTQHPIEFKAVGLFNLSIAVFLKIVQSSLSYYTMLKKMSG